MLGGHAAESPALRSDFRDGPDVHEAETGRARRDEERFGAGDAFVRKVRRPARPGDGTARGVVDRERVERPDARCTIDAAAPNSARVRACRARRADAGPRRMRSARSRPGVRRQARRSRVALRRRRARAPSASVEPNLARSTSQPAPATAAVSSRPPRTGRRSAPAVDRGRCVAAQSGRRGHDGPRFGEYRGSPTASKRRRRFGAGGGVILSGRARRGLAGTNAAHRGHQGLPEARCAGHRRQLGSRRHSVRRRVGVQSAARRPGGRRGVPGRRCWSAAAWRKWSRGGLRQTLGSPIAALREHQVALVCTICRRGRRRRRRLGHDVRHQGRAPLRCWSTRSGWRRLVEHPPLRVETVRQAERFTLERFAEGSERFRQRFIRLGIVLLGSTA